MGVMNLGPRNEKQLSAINEHDMYFCALDDGVKLTIMGSVLMSLQKKSFFYVCRVHHEPANDEQNGHPVTSRSAEQTTGLQVLKPRSSAPTTSRTPNYWDNAAKHERVDEHATLSEPEPLMDAAENGSKSSHDGTDTEQAASSSPETSSAETSRESWVVSLSEGEERKVSDHENGEELVELLVDEAHFPPLDVGRATSSYRHYA
ncbi:hypothetical protein MRX96_004668 [Rhipicephalus microplus]